MNTHGWMALRFTRSSTYTWLLYIAEITALEEEVALFRSVEMLHQFGKNPHTSSRQPRTRYIVQPQLPRPHLGAFVPQQRRRSRSITASCVLADRAGWATLLTDRTKGSWAAKPRSTQRHFIPILWFLRRSGLFWAIKLDEI